MISTDAILAYAASHYPFHLDTTGEVDLTSLEEAVIDAFEMTDEEFSDRDLSFAIFTKLDNAGVFETDPDLGRPEWDGDDDDSLDDDAY